MPPLKRRPMGRFQSILFLLPLLTAAVPGHAQQADVIPVSPPVEPVWPWEDPLFAAAANRFFDTLYAMEYDACEALIDSLAEEHPGNPMIDVLRVRVYRDLIREVDLTKEEREQQFEKLRELFVPLRAKAEALLAENPAHPEAHLALGWEGMITAQVQVMLKDLMGANGTSKRAREHLDKVLEVHPDSPDASALLGGYLYSVDTLPKFLKFFKWVPFLPIPSGDRVLGLRLIADAARSGSPSKRDFTLFYGFLDTFYEGNFDRGEAHMGPFFYAFPDNPRFGIGMSLMAPFHSRAWFKGTRYWSLLLGEWRSVAHNPAADSRAWHDSRDLWSIALAMRMKMVAAYEWEAMGRPDAALPLYEELASDPHGHGRRVKGPVSLGLARSALLMGDPERALESLDVILEGDDDLKPWRGPAEDLRDEIERDPPDYDIDRWRETGLPVIEALEAMPDPAADAEADSSRNWVFRRSRLRQLDRHAESRDPVLLKLLADAYVLAGLPYRAMKAYDEVLELTDGRPSLWAIEFQARLNRSDILDRRGEFKDALEEMKRADDLIKEEDLLRYSVDARMDALHRAEKAAD